MTDEMLNTVLLRGWWVEATDEQQAIAPGVLDSI